MTCGGATSCSSVTATVREFQKFNGSQQLQFNFSPSHSCLHIKFSVYTESESLIMTLKTKCSKLADTSTEHTGIHTNKDICRGA